MHRAPTSTAWAMRSATVPPRPSRCTQNFETVPLLLVATLWYLILTTALSIGQSHLERHFGRGQVPLRARRTARG